MKGLREVWNSSNTVIRIVVVGALPVVVVAGLVFGLGVDWLVDLLNR